jgi:hypothetical protein
VLPAPPDSVLGFVRRFLSAIKDDSPTCSTSVIQDKISLGSGEMAKSWGICVGRKEWNRRVSTSSAGLS